MSEATVMLAAYIAAETSVLSGQSYTMNGRTLTKANLDEIRRGRAEWQSVVRAEQDRAAGRQTGFSVANFRDA